MNTYTFVPMQREYAAAIVDTWKYEKEYSIYDYSNEADHMLDEEGWGRGIFAVLNQAGDLIGELSIEFFDAQGEYTDYRDFDDKALLDGREMWIGFGLRPDLVGQGFGVKFVLACVEYAVQTCQYRGESIRLGVATFNQRAIKTYQRAGFQIFDHSMGEISGKTFECVYMHKKL
jgi:ribosomal-protein-alanine N-acetyltransferase